jgi:hypothetical protein
MAALIPPLLVEYGMAVELAYFTCIEDHVDFAHEADFAPLGLAAGRVDE